MVHPLYFAIPVISLGIAAVYYLWKTPSPNNPPSGPGFSQSSNCSTNQRASSRVRRRKKAESDNDCQICLDATSNIELQPCHHRELCESCVLSIITKLDRRCPFCRQYITGYIDI